MIGTLASIGGQGNTPLTICEAGKGPVAELKKYGVAGNSLVTGVNRAISPSNH